jgi:hypothetical protein
MKPELAPVAWMAGGFLVALMMAAVVLVRRPPDVDGIGLALRVTARWSFLLFWIAYSGRDLAALLPPAVASVVRRSREFGLAFAAAHLVHIGLVILLWRILHHAPLSSAMVVFFGIGIFWTYLLAFFSLGRLSALLGPRLWRAARLLGSNYLLLAFAKDFVPPVMYPGSALHNFQGVVAYVPFAAMCIAALVLRLSAVTLQQRRSPAPGTRWY